MVTEESTHQEVLYEPTAGQAKRAQELRRFNLLYVYLPVGLMSAITVITVVLLLFVAITQPNVEAILWLSGIADIALVLAMLPVIAVGAFVLGLFAYIYIQARRNGTAPIRQTQRLLWRMDNVAGRLRVRTDEAAMVVIQPFFKLQGVVAYVRALITQIIDMVRRG
jgi:hypothetical protein